MKNTLSPSLKSSISELKNVRTITTLGMLVALNVILFLFFSVKITDSIRLSFSYVPIAVSGMLFGPVGAGLAGIASDIINCVIKPMGPYHVGYTISAMLTGITYGAMLYKRKPSIKRIFIAKLIILVFIELALNTYWSYSIYGSGVLASFGLKALKSFILLPIECSILFFVSKFIVEKIKKHVFQ